MCWIFWCRIFAVEFSLDKKAEKIIFYNFLNYCIHFLVQILLASSWFCTWNNLNQSEEPLVDASQILAGFLKSILHISRFISWIRSIRDRRSSKFDSSLNLCTFNCIENLTENYAVCNKYKKASDEKWRQEARCIVLDDNASSKVSAVPFNAQLTTPIIHLFYSSNVATFHFNLYNIFPSTLLIFNKLKLAKVRRQPGRQSLALILYRKAGSTWEFILTGIDYGSKISKLTFLQVKLTPIFEHFLVI